MIEGLSNRQLADEICMHLHWEDYAAMVPVRDAIEKALDEIEAEHARIKCPYCGSAAREYIERPNSFAVFCRNCEARGPMRATKEEALKDWKEVRK